MAEDKGHKPTAKKLKQARQDGKVGRSPLVGTALAFLIVISICYFGLRFAWVRNKILLEYLLTNGYVNTAESFALALKITVISIGSCLIFGAAASILGGIAQVGFKIEPVVLSPKLSRIDFGAGVLRVFTSFKDLIPASIKLCLLCTTFAGFAYTLVQDLPTHAFGELSLSLEFFDLVIRRTLYLGAALLASVAGLDFFLKRRDFLKQMSMSLTEIRDEFKEDSGDPHIRSARRAMHQALSMQEIVTRVRKSKVIVVERATGEMMSDVAQSG